MSEQLTCVGIVRIFQTVEDRTDSHVDAGTSSVPSLVFVIFPPDN